MGVRFGILGPLEVLGGDGAPLPALGAKPRTVLALLLLRPGAVVPTDVLCDALWGDDQPAGPANALQRHVSALRKVVGDTVVAAGGGYRLDVDPADVDAHRFEALAAEGREALEAGDPERAAVLLHEALGLWRGRALGDAGDVELLEREAARLEETRLAALDDRVDADLAGGRHAELVPELEALTAEHPLRERLWAARMVALYRSGRQADALRAYQSARTLLGEELGLEPGPALRAVEGAIARHDPSLDLRGRRSGNLSRPITSFVGRAAELDALVEALGRHRLVTLVGPGGVGKTRLAVEAALGVAAPADGVWLVELAPIAAGDDDAVPGAVAGALGIGEVPDGGLAELLADRRALVVVDNCEHVRDGAATLVAGLLGHAPGLRVLATSREPLGVPGEQVVPLEPLTDADAAALFADRAAAAAPGFTLTDDVTASSVAELCRHLDGMPLAIELAAARTRALPPAELVARLGDRFRLLAATGGAVADRQRTLRAAVDWSYDLLFEDERTVFLRASVFAGALSLDAAEEVASAAGVERASVADLVARLVDKSMLIPTPGATGVRFRMLETLRAYGRDRLAEEGRLWDACDRHAAWLALLVQRGRERLRGPDDVHWFRRVAEAQDDVRAALRFDLDEGDPRRALRTAIALGRFWGVRGQRHEGGRWLDEVRAATVDDAVDDAHVWGAIWRLALGLYVDPIEVSQARAEECVRLAETHGDPLLVAVAQTYAADARRHVDVPGAMGLVDAAEPALTEAGDHDTLGLLFHLRAAISATAGRVDRHVLDRAMAECEAGGDRWGLVGVRLMLGEEQRLAGELDESVATLETALADARELEMATNTVRSLSQLARTHVLRGENDRAAARWTEARAVAEWMGWDVGVASCDAGLGGLDHDAGDLEAARVRYSAALAGAPAGALGSGAARVAALTGLAWLALDVGDLDEARRLGEEAVVAAETGDAMSRAPALDVLAAATGDAALWARADARRRELGPPRTPLEERLVSVATA